MAATKRKTTKRATKAKRGSGKRTLLKNRAGTFYARRSAKGRFK